MTSSQFLPRLIPGADAQGPGRHVLIVCDHASNAVPPGIDLGVSADTMTGHVAWDIGAAAVTELLAAHLGCPAWLAQVSRLVVDCNRPPDHSIPEQSDGIVIPGNVGLCPTRQARRLALHKAFHDGLAGLVAHTRPALIVSVHSFTPALVSAPAPRPWPIAILWNRDFRAAELGLAALAAEPELGGPPGANQPYSGQLLNHTMDLHAEANQIPYLGFEIRQDLIGDAKGAARLAGVAARTITTVLEGLCRAS